MQEFHVTWEIDVPAENAVDAARQALEIQRDPASIATSFTVTSLDGESEQVDLAAVEEDLRILRKYEG